MSHSIVVGYDGSPCAKEALEHAAEFARNLMDGEIIVVYSHEQPPIFTAGDSPACEAALELHRRQNWLADDYQPLLDEAADRVRVYGVKAETRLVWDEPCSALLAAAHETDSCLIVVGSHGEGALAGLWSGAPCFRLLHASDVPVMVVPYRH